MSFAVKGVAQLAMTVGNVERSVAFYRDVVGLKFLFTAPPGLGFLECGGTRLMLATRESGGPDEAHPAVYYRVDSVRDAAADLTARGIALHKEPHVIAKLPHADLWLAFILDPDGHLVGFMSEEKA
ncbi:MAG TPA: VOC family protein [Candidatus Polarisedimenticolaceae bacterium]|nr:VOC family protein [Candidatus Polarisedimenticolaceae bacterium]